jgi:hypothetical protein
MAERAVRATEKPAPRRGPRFSIDPGAEVRFGRRNYLWLGVAISVIVVGFIALAMGSTSLAPILLVAGYVVGVPYALMVRQNGGAEG